MRQAMAVMKQQACSPCPGTWLLNQSRSRARPRLCCTFRRSWHVVGGLDPGHVQWTFCKPCLPTCEQAGEMAVRAAEAAQEAADQRAAAEAELTETRAALEDERSRLAEVQVRSCCPLNALHINGFIHKHLF